MTNIWLILACGTAVCPARGSEVMERAVLCPVWSRLRPAQAAACTALDNMASDKRAARRGQ